MISMRAKAVCNTFMRKFKTFRKDPLGSSCEKIQAWTNRFTQEARPERLRTQIRQLCHHWAERQLRKRGYLDFLTLRPSHALLPDFTDLWFLYQTTRNRKPRYILEFGSGCSTVILAQALWDNRRASPQSGGHLYSIDADHYWAEVTARSIPQHLLASCEIYHSPLLEVEYEGTPAFRHAKLPDLAPDLLYLDGPAFTPERQVAVDVLDIEETFPSGFCMIIDGRWQNTIFLKEHLKRRYLFTHRRLFSNSVFELIA